MATQAATANSDSPIVKLSILDDLGVVNALLRTVPNAAHVITAGKPQARLSRTRSTLPENPVPNRVPKDVIKTKK